MDLSSAPAALTIFLTTVGISLYAFYGNQEVYGKLMLHPYSIVHDKQWYRMIGVGFVHADIAHLMFNMLTFFFFAFKLETMTGTMEFIILYFGSMVISSIPTVIKNKDNFEYRAVGASGAISGILFSFILFAPNARIGIMFLPIGIPSPIFALLYLGYCWYASRRAGEDFINHSAHLWGALAGLVITIIMVPEVLPYFLERVFRF